MTDPRTGTTSAGTPYLAVPPANPQSDSPLVVVWHLMDAPRSEAAMAAAIPLAGVEAWKVYFGLPMFGVRTPAGGLEAIFGLLHDDAVTKFYGPIQDQAVHELAASLPELRAEFDANGPLALVGGSAGGAIALTATAELDQPIAGTVVLNPVVRMTRLIEAVGKEFDIDYHWSEDSRAIADRFDFIARAAELADHPLLFIDGEQDEPSIREPVGELVELLQPGGNVERQSIPGLAHALAEEPGVQAAPQTPGAVTADGIASAWLTERLR